MSEREVTVLQTGPLATLQDFGRGGHAHLGVSPSGALDQWALWHGNEIVGNNPADVGIEVLLGGLQLRFREAAAIAVTGARGVVRVDAREVPQEKRVEVPAGGLLDVAPAQAGLRYYVAIDGGVHAPLVLGSASTDQLSGIGPAPLAAGDVLTLNPTVPDDGFDPFPPPEIPIGDVVVRVQPGPRRDWFTPEAWLHLLTERWVVGHDSNRVGMRLDGAPLERSRAGELPSEGIVTGAVQVPGSGLPTIFLADHPTTGGYPVMAVVVEEDLDGLAQVRPGQGLRFTDGAIRVRPDLQARVNRVERAIGRVFGR